MDNDEIHQSYQHKARDDRALQTLRPAQKPSRQSENNEMIWQPRLRNEALLNDMFGAQDCVIYPEANRSQKRKSGNNNNDYHGHVEREQL